MPKGAREARVSPWLLKLVRPAEWVWDEMVELDREVNITLAIPWQLKG